MTPPVIFYMFLNIFAPIVINDQFLTTIIFNESVYKPHSGADKNILHMELSPNAKMIFIKSLGTNVETNLNVMGSSGYLYSFLVRTGKRPHSIVQLKDGVNVTPRSFKMVKNLRGVILKESKYTAKVVNKTKKSIIINSRTIKRNEHIYLAKGAPVFLNGNRVFR